MSTTHLALSGRIYLGSASILALHKLCRVRTDPEPSFVQYK